MQRTLVGPIEHKVAEEAAIKQQTEHRQSQQKTEESYYQYSATFRLRNCKYPCTVSTSP